MLQRPPGTLLKKSKLPSLLQSGFGGMGNQDSGESNIPSFFAPLMTTVVPTIAGAPTATYSRATPATVTDWESVVRPVLSGEVRFQGARRVRNELTGNSTNLSGGAFALDAFGTGTVPTFTANFATAPDGTLTASRLQLQLNGGTTTGDRSTYTFLAGNPVPRNVSCWIKANSGTPTVQLRIGSAVSQITLDSTWRRYSAICATAVVDTTTWLGLRGGQAPTNSDTADILVWDAQVEYLTGQSNQNPSEYVSVGVLSTPFHGANVDGVKYFSTQNGNTVASNVVTEGTGNGLQGFKWSTLPGASGSYFATPDSAANSVTGDIDVRWKGALDSWTVHPSTNGALIAKMNNGAPRAWDFLVLNTGALQFRFSSDGTTLSGSANSSVAVTTVVANGGLIWFRVTRVASSGLTRFYYSSDGVVWAQLGTDQNTGAGAIFDAAQEISIGGENAAAGLIVSSGKHYYAEVRNGIDGPAVVTFNPSLWTTGATWTASTGEVWTINGTASVFDPKALYGYLAEGARTNLCLQSEDLATSWVATDTTITANNIAAPDGLTTADLLTEGVAGTATVNQSVTATADVNYVSTRFLKRGNTDWIQMTIANGANIVRGWFNLGTGAVGSTAVAGTAAVVAARIKPFPNGWYRCELVGSVGSAATAIASDTRSASADASTARVNNATYYAWGAQFENNVSFASSYIPTTTASVTRNADVLTYPFAGNASATNGTIYAEVSLIGASGVQVINDFPGGSLFITGDATTIRTFDGSGSITKSGLTSMVTGIRKRTNSYGGTTRSVTGDGDTPATGVFDGSTGSTLIAIGSNSGGGESWFGTIRNCRSWRVQKSDQYLQQITTA